MTFFGYQQIVPCAIAKTGLTLRPHFLPKANPIYGWTTTYLRLKPFQPQQPPPWRGRIL